MSYWHNGQLAFSDLTDHMTGYLINRWDSLERLFKSLEGWMYG